MTAGTNEFYNQEADESQLASQGEAYWMDQGAQLTDEEMETMRRLQEVMSEVDRRRIPSLRGMPKKRLMKELGFVSGVIGKVKTRDITATNDLVYAASVVVTERLGN